MKASVSCWLLCGERLSAGFIRADDISSLLEVSAVQESASLPAGEELIGNYPKLTSFAIPFAFLTFI